MQVRVAEGSRGKDPAPVPLAFFRPFLDWLPVKKQALRTKGAQWTPKSKV